MTEIGTRTVSGDAIVFENEKVVIRNFVLEPGAETPMHTHEHDYTWYTIAGATLQTFDEHGNDCGTMDIPTGAVVSLKLDNGSLEVVSELGKGLRVPATHRAINVGSTTYREVLVEYK